MNAAKHRAIAGVLEKALALMSRGYWTARAAKSAAHLYGRWIDHCIVAEVMSAMGDPS